MNKRVQTKNSLSKRRNNKKQRFALHEEANHLDSTPEENSDMCILSEEVVGSVYAGRHMKHSTTDGSARPTKTTESPITIIMDIQWQPTWTFGIDAGAWRSKQ